MRLRTYSIFTLLCLLLISGRNAVQSQAPITSRSEPRFEVVVRKNIRVAVRDGTHLALDVYLPSREGEPVLGKHPTLLARTPYNKEGAAAEARWFAARGYAVVLNDVRGRYASDGE